MTENTTSFREHLAEIEANLEPPDRKLLDTLREHYSLSSQLIELRKRHNLSQEQVADRAGIDQSEISKLERGSGNPTKKTLDRVARVLGARLGLIEDADPSQSAEPARV